MIKIKPHYGIKDYYKFYKNNYNNTVDPKTYNNVISDLNNLIIDKILNNNYEYKLPELGITINIRKDKRVPKIKEDGTIHNNRPVDWKATKKLWNANPESKLNKTLIRFRNRSTLNYVFRIIINKTGVNFKNKNKYKFKAARGFKRALASRIKDGSKSKFDAFLLYKEKNK